MATMFQYPPLDKVPGAIRLLVLSPDHSRADNGIQCRLVPATLDAAYEALSYTWGTPDDLGLKIWVNDFHFPVRKNLYCALTAFRSTTERHLWIDALCINQDDSDEKGRQVGMMDLIYEKSKQVLVWLGYPDEFGNLAVNFDEPSSSITKAPYEAELLPAFELVTSIVERSKKPLGFDEWGYFRPYFRQKWTHHWQQLAAIYNAAYWSRLWIVQEFGLATKLQILYGTSSCHGDIFLAFRELIYQLPVWASAQDQGALFHATSAVPDIGLSMKKIMGSKAMHLPMKVKHTIFANVFENILSSCEEQFCAERRDKIYALLRLPHDLKGDDIPIDYNASIPQLYERALGWSCRRASHSSGVARFSAVVQRALLGPLSLDDSPVEMFDAPQFQHALFFAQPEIQYEYNTLLVEQVWVIPLSKPWNDTTLEDIRNSEQLLKHAPEHIKNIGQTQLVFSLERLREADPTSILSLEDANISSGTKLFAFKNKSGSRIGLGPHSMQDGDILCRSAMHVVALCRGGHDGYRFVGRAAVAPGERGKRKADITRHHPLWPPPDLDIYSGAVDDVRLVRRWMVSISLLQGLTCPLKWRKT
jgi:hypothetical protein